MTASRIIVWRHGQTDWNRAERFQGQSDIPLNEVGRQQVRQAAQVLAGYGPTRLMSSDLSRALDTASALASLTNLQVEVDERFREISVGSWDGLTMAEVAARGEWDGAHDDARRSPTGETPTEVGLRFAEALTEHAESTPDGGILVVAAHGLAARVGACAFLGMPPGGAVLLYGMDNAGWLVMDLDLWGTWRLRAYNRRAAAPE